MGFKEGGLPAFLKGVLEGVQEAKRPPEGSPRDRRMMSEGALKRKGQIHDLCNSYYLISPFLNGKGPRSKARHVITAQIRFEVLRKR